MAEVLTLQSRPELRWGYSVHQSHTVPTGSTSPTLDTETAPDHPLYLEGDPQIMENASMIEVPLVYGTKYELQDETAIGRYLPDLKGCVIPLNAYVLPPFIRAFLQYGSKDVNVSTMHDGTGTYAPVVSGTGNIQLATPGTPFVLAVTRSFEVSARKGQQIYGALPSTISINGEDGGIWKLGFDLLGFRYRKDDIAPAAAASSTFGKVLPVSLFKGTPAYYGVSIYTTPAGTPAEVPIPMRSFSGQWVNNAEITGWSTDDPQAIGFGNGIVRGTGTFVVACDPSPSGTGYAEEAMYAAWKARTVLGFEIRNRSGATVTSAGEFEIRFGFMLTGEPTKALGPAGIYELTVPFVTRYASVGNGFTGLYVTAHDNLSTWT